MCYLLHLRKQVSRLWHCLPSWIRTSHYFRLAAENHKSVKVTLPPTWSMTRLPNTLAKLWKPTSRKPDAYKREQVYELNWAFSATIVHRQGRSGLGGEAWKNILKGQSHLPPSLHFCFYHLMQAITYPPLTISGRNNRRRGTRYQKSEVRRERARGQMKKDKMTE